MRTQRPVTSRQPRGGYQHSCGRPSPGLCRVEVGEQGPSGILQLPLLLGGPPPSRQPGACVTQWPQGQHSPESRAAGPARHTWGIRLRRPGCGPSWSDGRQSERLLGSQHGPAEEQAERGPACREEGPLPPQSPQCCSAWPQAPLRQTHPPEAAHSQRTPGPARNKSGYSQPRVSGSMDIHPALKAATPSAHHQPGNGGHRLPPTGGSAPGQDPVKGPIAHQYTLLRPLGVWCPGPIPVTPTRTATLASQGTDGYGTV